MKQSELIEHIEYFAPPDFAANWDNSGIQVASPRTEITHLAICLDPSPVMIKLALNQGADMILTHHPLSMQARFLNCLDSYYNIVSMLIQAQVPLYSAHTSLDANSKGPVAWLADELKLSERQVLEPVPNHPEHGVGLAGNLEQHLDYQSFFKMLAACAPCLAKANINLCGADLPEKIKRIAICPGSGASLLSEAIAAKSDLFITGDIKYHTALDSQISLLDVGHFSLEEEMMCRFANEFKKYLKVTFLPARDPFHKLVLS